MVVCYRGDSGIVVPMSSGPNRVYFVIFLLLWCKKENELQKYWILFAKMVVLPITAMKAYRRSRSRGPPIQNLYSGWRWVAGIMLWPIYLQKWNPHIPTEQEAGWTPKPVWSNFVEGKHFLLLLGTFWNTCFRNARCILFGVTLEIVQRNVSGIVHIVSLSKNCVVQLLL
jgi:hypothetical protein